MKYAVRFFLLFDASDDASSDALRAIEQFAQQQAEVAHDGAELIPGVDVASIETYYAAFPEGSAVFTAIQEAAARQGPASGGFFSEDGGLQ